MYPALASNFWSSVFPVARLHMRHHAHLKRGLRRYRGNPGSCEHLGISSGVKLGLTWGPQQPHGARPRSPALAAGIHESPLIGSLKGWPRCADPTPTWAVLGGHCPRSLPSLSHWGSNQGVPQDSLASTKLLLWGKFAKFPFLEFYGFSENRLTIKLINLRAFWPSVFL